MKLNQSNEYTTELEFDYGDTKFTCRKFQSGKPMVSLDYVEHSPDCWYSDSDKSIDLTKQDAEAIIEFLKYSFDLE